MLWEVIWKRIVLVFVVNLGPDQLEIAVLNIILLQSVNSSCGGIMSISFPD